MSAEPGPKISLALGAKKPSKFAPINGIKRPRAALGDGDDDGDDEDGREGRAETVSHFDKREGGAIDFSMPKENGPLVIAPQSNRDWKEASQRSKRQRSGLPPDANQEGLDERVAEIEAQFERKKAAFGLNVKKRESAVEVSQDVQAEVVETLQRSKDETVTMPRTDEERAVEALLGKREQSDLVLPGVANEEEAFHRDITSAPNMATLADYDRVPVEQFGAALLRGMGWKDGEGIGSQRGKKVEKSKIPGRRPALLGIGAKEEAAVAQEMGVWGKAARGKGGEVKIYNPVLLRDKRTGEKFTEAELEKRKAAVEREKYEMEFEERERKRRKDEDDEELRRGGRRGDEYRRDERDRDGRRREEDKEYFRRKERERRRKERDREDNNSRSSRRYEDRHKGRDRNDSRDREREREQERGHYRR